MILTCPECATRFSIESDAIGPNGRTVRCSQCSETWFASADPDILSLNEIQNTQSINEQSVESEQNDDYRSEIAKDDQSADVGIADSAPHAEVRNKAERKKVRRRLMGVLMIWLTTLAILIVAATIAYLFRAQIVEKFPSTRPLYDVFGVEATVNGLIIHDIRTEFGEVDGTPVLFINGEIKNYDLQSRDVPLVQINFKNDNGEILANWVIEPPKSRLKKGERQQFSSQYPNPPIDATKLVPVFVDETAITTTSIDFQ